MTDRATIRMVVGFLGLAVLGGLAAGVYLAATHNPVPEFVVATTSGALGAVAGILAKTSSPPTAAEAAAMPAEVTALPVAELREAGPMRIHRDDITAVGEATARAIATSAPAKGRQGRS